MIREILTHPQEIAWLPWAVQYFFFIGISATAALVAIALRFMGKGQLPKAEMIALTLATTTGIVAPLALSADLHQPGRFINFYISLTPWSWMWIGAIVLPVFLAFLLMQYLCVIRENTVRENTFKLLRFVHFGQYNEGKIIPFTSIILALASLGILLYTGKEVNVLKAQAIWHSPWLPWVFFFTALQCVPMLVKTWKEWAKIDESNCCLNRIQLIALLGVIVSLVAWAMSDTPAGVAFRSLPAKGSVWLTIGFGILTYLVCLVLYTLYAFSNDTPLHWFVSLILTLMSLSLAWTVRWAILMQAQTLPKYNIIINPYHLSWGSDGALGIISTFGLWLTLLIVFWSLLNDRWLTFKGVQHG